MKLGTTSEGKNEPPREYVVGRHDVAAHGPAAQPDDHHRRVDRAGTQGNRLNVSCGDVGGEGVFVPGGDFAAHA